MNRVAKKVTRERPAQWGWEATSYKRPREKSLGRLDKGVISSESTGEISSGLLDRKFQKTGALRNVSYKRRVRRAVSKGK